MRFGIFIYDGVEPIDLATFRRAVNGAPDCVGYRDLHDWSPCGADHGSRAG